MHLTFVAILLSVKLISSFVFLCCFVLFFEYIKISYHNYTKRHATVIAFRELL